MIFKTLTCDNGLDRFGGGLILDLQDDFGAGRPLEMCIRDRCMIAGCFPRLSFDYDT